MGRRISDTRLHEQVTPESILVCATIPLPPPQKNTAKTTAMHPSTHLVKQEAQVVSGPGVRGV